MRAVIAGAGVVGLACAWELERRGIRVVLIDPREPGTACSWGNAGWVTPSLAGPLPHPAVRSSALRLLLDPKGPLFIEPRALPALAGWLWQFFRNCNPDAYRAGLEATGRLGSDTHTLFDEWADEGIRFEMHCSGLLFLLRETDHLGTYLKDLNALAHLGYATARELDAGETRELEPAVGAGVRAGIWVPEERHVRPDTLCAGLVDRLSERGVSIRSGATVTGVRCSGGRVNAFTIRDQDGAGRVEGDLFLIAAGAWSGEVAASCGCKLPIQAGKGYSLTVDAPALELRQPLYLVDAKIGISPFDTATRVAGTLELSGVNEHLDERRVGALVEAAEEYVPGVSLGGVRHEWVGMRPITPDGLPVLGKLPLASNFYIASGHALLGVTLAPSSARSLTDMMTGEASPNLEAFDPRRFESRWPGVATASGEDHTEPRSLLGSAWERLTEVVRGPAAHG